MLWHRPCCVCCRKNYVEISHQVDGGFELLAHTQGIETTEGLYQAHARYILNAWDEGGRVLVYPLKYPL